MDVSSSFFVIPYINTISELVTLAVRNNKTKNSDLRIEMHNRLDRFIKAQKDKNDVPSNSNVIYKINCKDCDASYVGQTKRKLHTRLNKHLNNIKLDSSKHSVISQHITNECHNFDWKNVIIMDNERIYNKRLIS